MKFLFFSVILVMICSCGCIGSSIYLEIPSINMSVGDSESYTCTLVNYGGLLGVKYENVTLELRATGGLIEIDESYEQVTIEELKPDDAKMITLYVTGLSRGKTVATLRVRHSEGYKDRMLPVEVR
jgi:uncharacterized membrane protein